jgi:tetratricopeptide (TPR) repeat protein
MTTKKAKGLPVVATDREDAVQLQRAQKLLGQKKYDEAGDILEKLTNPVTTPLRANATLLFAGVELMQGRADHALEVLERAPASTEYKIDEGYRHMIKASAYRQMGEIGQALAHARAAVTRGETSGRLLTLADALKHADELEEAITTLQRALQIEPDNAVALAVLAGYQVLAGEIDEAKETFSQFLDVAPKDGDTARNTAFFYAVMGDRKRTVACLRAALDDDAAITKAYIADEVEFDRFRKDPEFAALSR